MIKFSEIVLTALLILIAYPLIGALVARNSREKDRRNLFYMGICAPALIAALAPLAISFISGGLGSITSHRGELAPISVAHAEAPNSLCTTLEKFSLLRGFRSFFGVEEPRKYHVIVGSFNNRAAAENLAKTVNSEDASFKAYVGNRALCNDNYPVVVSPYVSLDEAKKIQERALQLKSVTGAYLSPIQR